MREDDPSHTYYRACVGRWRCAFEFVITDRAAFRASPIGRVDRLRVLSMLALMRAAGPLVFATTVDLAGDAVVHTTRLVKWGVALLASEETITLAPNGRDFTLRGRQRFWPLGRGRVIEGVGRVDETATRATYDLELFGARVRQTTIRHAEGVDVTQETPWSRGVQRLRRA